MEGMTKSPGEPSPCPADLGDLLDTAQPKAGTALSTTDRANKRLPGQETPGSREAVVARTGAALGAGGALSPPPKPVSPSEQGAMPPPAELVRRTPPPPLQGAELLLCLTVTGHGGWSRSCCPETRWRRRSKQPELIRKRSGRLQRPAFEAGRSLEGWQEPGALS